MLGVEFSIVIIIEGVLVLSSRVAVFAAVLSGHVAHLEKLFGQLIEVDSFAECSRQVIPQHSFFSLHFLQIDRQQLSLQVIQLLWSGVFLYQIN